MLMKFKVFGSMMSCKLVNRVPGPYSVLLQNVSNYVPVYTTSHPTRLQSSLMVTQSTLSVSVLS